MAPPGGADLSARFRNQMILAPLTRGGNLPFRRLCADFGCEVSMGEMVFARYLVKGERVEQARLRRSANEQFFGVQIATNDAEEGIAAAKLADAAGADFIDLNCGCPIYEATRRGLGSAMLRNPGRLAGLVQGIADKSPLPLSVKVRIASERGIINVREVVEQLRDAGAAAVTIHGRTSEQRYHKAADWGVIREVVADGVARGSSMPIVGNGDILTYYEACRLREQSGVDGVMVGRGALVKPWLFEEYKSRTTWEPTTAERIAVYRKLAVYMKEHFGDDDRGRKKSWYFFPWHFDFLLRFRPLPAVVYEESSRNAPLIQTRFADSNLDEASPLDRLLTSKGVPGVYELIADALWNADSDADAVTALTALAVGDRLEKLKHEAAAMAEEEADSELANIPSSTSDGRGKRASDRKSGGRRRRAPPPQRSPEEIAAIRAERAAKRAATGGAPPHVNGKRR